MKAFKTMNGDLVSLSKEKLFDVIAHGCNCQKNMGKGIALEIAKQFPDAVIADKDFINPKLGDISIGFDDRYNLTIVNCYTQIWFGKAFDSKEKHPSNKFAEDTTKNRYSAIAECFKKINQQFAGQRLGIPMIGCGLAGLEWESVKNYIIAFLPDMDVTVVKFVKR